MKCIIFIPPTNERKTTVARSHPRLLTESSRLTGLPHFDRICRASVIVIVMSLDWLVVSVLALALGGVSLRAKLCSGYLSYNSEASSTSELHQMVYIRSAETGGGPSNPSRQQFGGASPDQSGSCGMYDPHKNVLCGFGYHFLHYR